MKEIDFLPSWYKQSRRKHASYKWQYGMIISGFVFMVCWSFFAGKIVGTSSAFGVENADIESYGSEVKICQQQIDELNKHAELINKCESKIVISNVVAELSGIIGNSIILNKVEISAKEFVSQKIDNSNSVIKNTVKKDKLFSDLIYDIVISGIAVDNNSVAMLICDLEDSEYFNNVITGYSKEVEQNDKIMSEFEISFSLANFNELRK